MKRRTDLPQGILQINTGIAQKGHLQMKTKQLCLQLDISITNMFYITVFFDLSTSGEEI